MGTGGNPGGGGVAILPVASRYRNRDKLRLCGSPWLASDFTFTKTFTVIVIVSISYDEKQRNEGGNSRDCGIAVFLAIFHTFFQRCGFNRPALRKHFLAF